MLLDLIKRRKSIRRYLNKPIARDDILTCIEAARCAPSACNGQPWKFIVVDDADLKKRLSTVAFSGVYAINKFAANAAALVVVISEKEKFITAMGGYFRGVKYYLIDIGIACEHLILQAQDLGIGSCWLGWFNEQAVKRTLDIPASKKIDVIISLGYYEQGAACEKSRKAQAEIVSFNSYCRK